MRRLSILLFLATAPACAAATAQESVHVAPHTAPHVDPHVRPHVDPHVAPHARAAEVGGAWVTMRGNYAGKHIRIWIDGELADDRRFTFPPPGAEDRLPVALGPARSVRIRIEIEDCDAVWEQDVAVAPGKSSSLIFDGCAVTPLRPE